MVRDQLHKASLLLWDFLLLSHRLGHPDVGLIADRGELLLFQEVRTAEDEHFLHLEYESIHELELLEEILPPQFFRLFIAVPLVHERSLDTQLSAQLEFVFNQLLH